ncbi:MAG: tRNA 2-thiocytidine biosynthesis TtcA family protein [Clostridia bacterium]
MASKSLLRKLIPIKRAIGDFDMIDDGERIAIGISGGKDSLTCLFALKTLLATLPVKYELIAIAVDLGWNYVESNKYSYDEIRQYCTDNDIKFIVEKTQISEIVFKHREESNPCSLCSKMRNGALINRAVREGCNKIALGHHLDDVIETALMSMFFSGKIDAFMPKAYLDRMKVTYIRPLVYMREKDIISIAKSYNLPVININLCPADGNTKRQYVKNLIKEQESFDPEIPLRIFSAVKKDIWKIK